MRLPMPDFWILDPLPIPPTSDRQSMTFWRWWSRVILQARKEQ